jgi:hypothetical protein
VWAGLAEGLEQFTLTAVSIGWRRPQRYQRAHETIQITQALWGSWRRDAGIKDATKGRFIDREKIEA